MAGGKFQVRLKAGDSEIEVEGERPKRRQLHARAPPGTTKSVPARSWLKARSARLARDGPD